MLDWKVASFGCHSLNGFEVIRLFKGGRLRRSSVWIRLPLPESEFLSDLFKILILVFDLHGSVKFREWTDTKIKVYITYYYNLMILSYVRTSSIWLLSVIDSEKKFWMNLLHSLSHFWIVTEQSFLSVYFFCDIPLFAGQGVCSKHSQSGHISASLL